MNRSNIEEVLPLAPLQEGLFFHAMADSDAAYTVQTILELEGALDRARLRTAAQALVDRHANLRTAFVVVPTGAVQVVLRQVDVPWAEAEAEAEAGAGGSGAGVRELAAAERARPFVMDAPPLIRFLLIRTGPRAHRLVITSHHILLDGWSSPLLLRDLFSLYAGVPAPRPRPYRDYLTWLAARNRDESLAVWRRVLDGLTEPTLLAVTAPPTPAAASLTPPAGGEVGAGAQGGDGTVAAPDHIPVPLAVDVQRRLRALAREHGVTLSTVVQAAWAITLSRFVGRGDVVFGATVSGRPPEIAGVESMVGLFINTVPVRVTVDPAETVAALLGRLHRTQSETLEHHHLGLAEVQALAGLGALFDTLVVVESYPVDNAAIDRVRAALGVEITAARTEDATHYPLTLVADPGAELRLELEHHPGLLAPHRAREVGELLGEVFAAMVEAPDVLPVARLAVAGPPRFAAKNAAENVVPEHLVPFSSVLGVWDGVVAAGGGEVAVVCGGV
ncbi:condensation domain-containing protein, partial [Frankia sp. AiPs1]|uniref:condensation domain-containing protein n=1 Tax=Frankia sp. AiPs1 TaxID=573493 RepID=UPI0020433F12